ncbi:hypothetical protein [Actinoplanes rectilineatus]|uniref:hypothetical protein n=1 Tax=Actinoplanes rectilineatus TaxID=113571 RepID=UPI0009FB5B07|nr:hypothetical protein [Actinoplanes rectilineatus]
MSGVLRIKLTADGDAPFTVMFEPLGMTYELGGGEHMFAEVQSMEMAEMEIVHWKGGVSVWPPGPVRTFDADGNLLDELHH